MPHSPGSWHSSPLSMIWTGPLMSYCAVPDYWFCIVCNNAGEVEWQGEAGRGTGPAACSRVACDIR